MVPKEPHIAALGRDQRLVEWMVGEWRAAGLDSVELATYDMYLSWPNQSDPNKIWLKGSGTQRNCSLQSLTICLVQKVPAINFYPSHLKIEPLREISTIEPLSNQLLLHEENLGTGIFIF